MIKPNYPQIILSFAYRGCKVEIDRDELNEGHCIYAAWHSRVPLRPQVAQGRSSIMTEVVL